MFVVNHVSRDVIEFENMPQTYYEVYLRVEIV
jgi:hypothetical protein